jgi:hypothetical protein
MSLFLTMRMLDAAGHLLRRLAGERTSLQALAVGCSGVLGGGDVDTRRAAGLGSVPTAGRLSRPFGSPVADGGLGGFS